MEFVGRAPTMNPAIVLAVLIGALVLSLSRFGGSDDKWTRFICVSIFLRLVGNFLHQFTIVPMVGGQSLNSLVTAFTVVWGVLLINANIVNERKLALYYTFMVIFALSALVNLNFRGFADSFLRYIYLLIFIMALRFSVARHGSPAVLRMVSALMAGPFVLQILSVPLGLSKATELDGSASYLGGYVHEAAFSSLGLFMLAMAICSPPTFTRVLVVFCAALSLFLANYRTAILAALPLLLMFPIGAVWRFLNVLELRLLAISVLVLGCVLALPFLVADGSTTRFEDIFTLMSKPESYIMYPWEYTSADRKIMSGRLVIWSNYIYAYSLGNALQHLLGFGPDSWKGVFEKYAHNVYVSLLYEVGVIGVVSYLAIFVSAIARGMRRRFGRSAVVCGIASTLIYGLGTIPLGNIEGVFFFGVVFASVYGSKLPVKGLPKARMKRSTLDLQRNGPFA